METEPTVNSADIGSRNIPIERIAVVPGLRNKIELDDDPVIVVNAKRNEQCGDVSLFDLIPNEVQTIKRIRALFFARVC